MKSKPHLIGLIATLSLALGSTGIAAGAASTRPAGTPMPTTTATATAVFAGGCFWGVDAVFKHVKGVSDVVSGYAGGNAATAHYEQVSNGDTGHAESVRVRFDPAQVSYQQLLQVFFSVAHDPTQLNRQGPDVGSQYRSAIFYTSAEQQQSCAKHHPAAHRRAHLFRAHRYAGRAAETVLSRRRSITRTIWHCIPTSPISSSTTCPSWNNLRKRFPALYR